jgi:hypothetical protein
MGTSSWLATLLDLEMLRSVLQDAHLSVAALPSKTGREVAKELGGRYLIRYVLTSQVGRYRTGSTERHWVTPTPYGPEEIVSWLALPDPTSIRRFAMILDPNVIPQIQGPKRILGGQGIEYFLPRGFPASAVWLGWEQEVR